MTLFVPQWATNLNYSVGPDTGTATKVDPSSTPNGFISGVIAAPQHVNYLIHEIADQLVKAIDGVGGGSYTLGSGLTLLGADVTFGSDVDFTSTSAVSFAGPLDINAAMDLDAAKTFTMHGILALPNGAHLNLADTANLDLLGTIGVHGGGSIDVTSGGDINVTSADVNINSGAQVVLNGGSLIIGATGSVQANGGDITLAAGSTLKVEAAAALIINDQNENFRLSLTPFSIQLTTGGDPRWKASTFGRWRQGESASVGLYEITFPLLLLPGDTLTALNVMLDGGPIRPVSLLPRVSILKVSASGTVTALSRTVDTSTTDVDYDAVHLVTLDSFSDTLLHMPLTITSDPHYVVIRGEQGGTDDTLEILSIFGQLTARGYRTASMVY